mmetsp:Transcript_1252/g.3431  ORF Transcript_1252/g.3431 Transcript_1252/m.3431 type:complete len:355 (+) Transcript_1252:127-1191(+)
MLGRWCLLACALGPGLRGADAEACGCEWKYRYSITGRLGGEQDLLDAATNPTGYCDVSQEQIKKNVQTVHLSLPGCAEGLSDSEECQVRRGLAEVPVSAFNSDVWMPIFLRTMSMIFDKCPQGDGSCAAGVQRWKALLGSEYTSERIFRGGRPFEWLLAYGGGLCRAHHEGRRGHPPGGCSGPCHMQGDVCTLDRSQLEEGWTTKALGQHCAAADFDRPCPKVCKRFHDACVADPEILRLNETLVTRRAIQWSVAATYGRRCREWERTYAPTCNARSFFCPSMQPVSSAGAVSDEEDEETPHSAVVAAKGIGGGLVAIAIAIFGGMAASGLMQLRGRPSRTARPRAMATELVCA